MWWPVLGLACLAIGAGTLIGVMAWALAPLPRRRSRQ